MCHVDVAVQTFGGSRFIRGYEVERLYRDARITRIYDGTSEMQRLIISRALLPVPDGVKPVSDRSVVSLRHVVHGSEQGVRMSAINPGGRPHPPGQEQIFRAAVESFHRKGYEGATVRYIADRAGVTPAALYHYYPSKQDLLVDIIDRFMQRSIRVTRQAVEHSGTSAADRLFAAARSHVLWNASDVASSFVVNSEIRSLEPANRAANIDRRDELQRIFDAIVQYGADSGEFAVPWPLEASRAVVVMCTFVARWYDAGGPLRPEAVADRYGHMALSLVEYSAR